MALTITKTKRNSVSGSKITAYMSVTFDVSYPAGGEAFDANAESGLGNIDEVRITTAQQGAGMHTFQYDSTNKKILAFGSTTQASGDAVDVGGAIGAGGLTLLELANTSDKLDGYRIDVVISGSR